MLTVAPTGVFVDVDRPVRTVAQTIADDGAAQTVWITGVGEAAVAAPAVITWPCACGQLITTDQYANWPHDDDKHLRHIDHRH